MGGMLHSSRLLTKFLHDFYEVSVILPVNAEYISSFCDDGISLIPIGLESDWNIGFSWGGFRRLFKLRREISRFLESDQIVICNNLASAFIFSFPIPLKRSRIVYVIRGGEYFGKIKLAYKFLRKRCVYVVFTSVSQQDLFVRFIGKPSDFCVIGNAVEFPPAIVESPSSFFNIAIVGFPSENKNQILAVEVLHQLVKQNQSFRLNIYGDPVQKAMRFT